MTCVSSSLPYMSFDGLVPGHAHGTSARGCMHAAATSISLSVARSSQCRRALLLLLAVDDDDLVVLAHGRGVALEKMMAALLDSSRHRPMSSGTTWRSPSYDWRFGAARAAAAAASGRGVVAASTSRSRRGRIHGGAQIPPPAFASSSDAAGEGGRIGGHGVLVGALVGGHGFLVVRSR